MFRLVIAGALLSCVSAHAASLTPQRLDFGLGGPSSPSASMRTLHLNNRGDVSLTLTMGPRVRWADGEVSVITPVNAPGLVPLFYQFPGGIADNGDVFVWGYAREDGNPQNSFVIPQRFTRHGGLENLATLEYHTYVNGAISRDGVIGLATGFNDSAAQSTISRIDGANPPSTVSSFDYTAPVSAFGRPGEMIGYAFPGASSRAYRLTEDGAMTVAEGQRSVAWGANIHGDAVGQFEAETNGFVDQAFIWRPDEATPDRLDTLDGFEASLARDINDHGVVVGQFLLDASEGAYETLNSRAAVWLADGTAIDLNTLIAPDSGWLLAAAWQINESNQIVGWGVYENSREVFILTIPAPASALPLGALGVVASRRRR